MHISSFTGYNIKSTGFRVSNIQQVVYLSDVPNSDGVTGSLFYSPYQIQDLEIQQSCVKCWKYWLY